MNTISADDPGTIIYSIGYQIKQFRERITRNDSLYDKELLLDQKKVEAITIDTTRSGDGFGIIYWTDVGARQIKRAKVPRQQGAQAAEQNLEVPSLEQPEGVAYDWVQG